METTEIQELLQAYVQHGSESAFRELVKRYLALVYSTALRQLGGQAQLAEDIAQTVFIDLARKARKLPPEVLLGGWLHKHACFVAANFLRSERRRLIRENQAAQMNAFYDHSDENWKKIAPVLDDAINELNPEDRDAVMLRYFEQCDFRSIGSTLGVSDDTAQKRVSRAIEKLRALLVNYGVTLSAAALGTLLAEQSVASIPSRLAENIAGTALTKVCGTIGAAKFFLSAKMGLVLLVLITVAGFSPFIISRISKFSSKNFVGNNFAQRNMKINSGALSSNEIAPTILKTQSQSANGILNSNILQITIINADTGRPISNVPVEERRRAEKSSKTTLVSDQSGICRVPLSSDLKYLQLTTRKENFSDTRLEWTPERGEKIPLRYTLSLSRPIRVSGRVLDVEDQPIENALVYFGCNEDVSLRKGPESHEFTWIKAKTDAQGRWQLNRIAEDVFNRAFGYAERTNYVPEHLGQMLSLEAAKQLRDGTHVFHLGPAMAANGVVVDSEGQPVVGAKIVINEDDERSTITGSDGKFSVNGCVPGRTGVKAVADGFTSATVETEISSNSPPVKVVLQRGKPFRLRVVNKAGEPVTNSTAHLQGIRRTSGTLDMTVYELFQPDVEGRIVWKSAPNEEMQFSVYAKGYGAESLWVWADGKEHIVTLREAVVVHGAVQDESGKPISRFQMIRGWPEVVDNKIIPHLGSDRSSWLTFAGGKFKYAFENRDINSPTETNSGYILKFESEGFASYMSRVVAPDEGDVELNITLRHAPDTFVKIVTPEGEPASRAEVALFTPGLYPIGIEPGKLGLSAQGGRLRANEQGQFQLPADDAIEKIIVAHSEGYSEIAPAELFARPIIQLQRWGKIEGSLLSGGKPVAGAAMQVQRISEYSYFNLTPLTDKKGEFQFPQVPPGRYTLSYLVRRPGIFFEQGHQHSKSVEVLPGETTTVNIGGSGYTVTVHLRWPTALEKGKRLRIEGAISSPIQELFQEPIMLAFSEKPESTIYFGLSFDDKSKLNLSPETKAVLQNANHYPFAKKSDDSFISEGVESGSGLLTFLVFFEKEIVAAGITAVSIPAEPLDGDVDLGEIELKLISKK